MELEYTLDVCLVILGVARQVKHLLLGLDVLQ
jgi:hypothetical protein